MNWISIRSLNQVRILFVSGISVGEHAANSSSPCLHTHIHTPDTLLSHCSLFFCTHIVLLIVLLLWGCQLGCECESVRVCVFVCTGTIQALLGVIPLGSGFEETRAVSKTEGSCLNAMLYHKSVI